MNNYVSEILEAYKDRIIGYLRNSGTADLLLYIVQCWYTCAVDEENQALPVVIYCSSIMYKYYSHLGFLLIKQNEEGNYIHKELFNNITHFIKKFPHVNCIHDDFFNVQ